MARNNFDLSEKAHTPDGRLLLKILVEFKREYHIAEDVTEAEKFFDTDMFNFICLTLNLPRKAVIEGIRTGTVPEESEDFD